MIWRPVQETLVVGCRFLGPLSSFERHATKEGTVSQTHRTRGYSEVRDVLEILRTLQKIPTRWSARPTTWPRSR